MFGEFPHTFQIHPLGMKGNNGKVQYLYQIKLDYHYSKRIFIEELSYVENKYRIKENTRGIIGLSRGGTPAMSWD